MREIEFRVWSNVHESLQTVKVKITVVEEGNLIV